jgi:predicted dehydrogenase
MLDENPEIDAVLISTPDHMHAPIAAHAMNLGKHLYVQKPLCHTVAEARFLAKRARETNVVTQMGNQGHAEEGARLINEMVADGALGTVQEVHCWTNRPVWPQGIGRPVGSDPIPTHINWDLWLGAASFRPFKERAYHWFNWRGWLDFGTGVVGDMGAHIIDHPYWALDLDLPNRISASSSRFGSDMETFPIASKIHFEFPTKGSRPPVKMTWYDGGLLPERPELLEQGRMLGDNDGGVLIVGDKNTLMHGVYGREPRLIPEVKHLEYQQPAKRMTRSPGIYQEWIDAIKDRSKVTTSDFEYAGRLTETMLLGNIATMRASENKVLEYDKVGMRFTNDEGANAYLDKVYRPGFGLV